MRTIRLVSIRAFLAICFVLPLAACSKDSVDTTYTGTITTHPNGYGFVKVEGFDDDIFINANSLSDAIHGDDVTKHGSSI